MSLSIARSLAWKPKLTDIVSVPLSVRWPTVALVAAMGAIVLLSFLAQPRRTGDAHQYLAMAWQFAALRPPSLDASDADEFSSWLTAQPEASAFPDGVRAIRQPALVRDGRQELSHFWFYPLLTAPFLRLATALGAHPIWAFATINAMLLGAAIWVASRVFGTLAAFTLVASPLVWFVARAQVEVFTVSLLCLAMAAAASARWGWAAIAIALASTQNLPIASTLPFFWVCATINWKLSDLSVSMRTASMSKQMRIAVAFVFASAVIAVLHPAYYLWRLGVFTPQQLNGGITTTLPSLQRFLAPLLDPDIGFLAWSPVTALLGIIGVALIVRATLLAINQSSRLLLPVACAILMAIWLLFAFAKTTNVNSGGTVYVSRYALWLIPLALPAIAVATKAIERRWPVVGSVAAFALFLTYAAFFRPDQPERYVEHSPQTNWIINHAPSLYAPLPEIFVERTLHIDGGPRLSAAVPNCSMIYIVMQQPDQPCPLTARESSAARELFASDADAVWIRRDMHGSSVSAASS